MIFQSVNLPDLSLELGEHIKNYLNNGSLEHGLPGLRTSGGPLFTVREGAGSPPFILGETEGYYIEEEDRPLLSRASVFFRDDISQVAPPYVKIISLVPEGNLLSYDYFTNTSEWSIVLDIVATESTGDVTEGESPNASSYILGAAVWQMLSHYESMKCQGFGDPKLKNGAPGMVGLQTKYPMTLSCDIYSYKTPPYYESSESSNSSESSVSSDSSE